MKKFLLLLGMLLCAFNLLAQNYDSYLQKAYTALEEGKIEVAQSSYNIYKKMTGITDSDFETLIKNADVNAWKKECNIILLNDTVAIAVQKFDQNQVSVTHQVAEITAAASRLGNFTDWRLPEVGELKVILPNIPNENELYFWCARKKAIVAFRKRLNTGKVVTESITSCTINAMNNKSYDTIETYHETIKNGITTERGSKNIIYKFLIVRTFNPNKE